MDIMVYHLLIYIITYYVGLFFIRFWIVDGLQFEALFARTSKHFLKRPGILTTARLCRKLKGVQKQLVV